MIAKKLTVHGNSLALVIDKPVLDLYGITRDSIIELTPDSDGLKLRVRQPEPGTPERTEALDRLKKRSDQKFSRMYKKLAE